MEEKILYHYTSQDSIMNIVKEEGVLLRFSKYDCLNDYNEGKEAIHIQQKVCKDLIDKHRKKASLLEKISLVKPKFESIFMPDRVVGPPMKRRGNTIASCEFVVTRNDSTPYICCLSKGKDLLPMWNYYSKNEKYEGYNIGIKTDNLKASVLDENNNEIVNPFRRFRIYEVIYDDAIKEKLINDEIIRILENNENLDSEKLLAEYQSKIDEWAICFKNSAFQHEQEIRLICYVPEDENVNSQCNECAIKFRASHGMMIPYVDVLLYKESLDIMTIGPLINEDIARKNLELYLQKKGYTSVKVMNSNIPIRY